MLLVYPSCSCMRLVHDAVVRRTADNESCVFNEEGEPRAKIEQAQTELKDANDKLQTDYDTVVAVIRRNI